MLNIFSVKNLNFLITGGLGQIGMELLSYLVINGSKIVIVDLADKKKIIHLKKKNPFLNSKNVKIYFTDITNKKNFENTFKKILKFTKKIDVLINLAATDSNNKGTFKTSKHNFHNFPYALIKKSLDVNLIGTLNTSQVLCNYFLKNKIPGNIINVASTYSIVAPNLNLYNNAIVSSTTLKNKPIDYVLSKSSMPNLTRYIATNYAKNKIRCNCLIPHGIKNFHKKDFVKKFSRLSPIGRMCNAKEIVGPVIFLASQSSSYMTGSMLIVDGGWTAW